MNDWTGGYVSDVDYILGFYQEQSPSHLNFVCLLNGFEPAPLGDTFSYCELGCGLGYTTGVLAASNPKAQFVGVDFSPSHIAQANAMAAAAGLDNVRFLDASFEELIGPDAPELPSFDVITLHGVFSWVSPANRQAIVKILHRYLKPGGIAYVSYNSLPGWSVGVPVQRLLFELARSMPTRSDHRVMDAIRLVQEFRDLDAHGLKDNPILAMIEKSIDRGDAEYLAHEYLNATWLPQYHIDVANELADARLGYVGSATVVENFPDLALTPEQKTKLAMIANPSLRETVRDYVTPRLLRRDVYVRGPRRIIRMKHEAMLRQVRLTMIMPQPLIQFTIESPKGEAKLNEDVYKVFVEALAEGPRTVGELLDLEEVRGREDMTAAEVAGMLVAARIAAPLVTDGPTRAADATRRFNLAMAEQIQFTRTNIASALAATAIGTGIHTNALECMAYLALVTGTDPNPDALARFAWRPVAARGEKLIHKGETIEGEEESLNILRERMTTFLEDKVPLFAEIGAI